MKKKSMMGSSKYEFNQDEFEKDVADKKEKVDKYTNELVELFRKDIRYRDNQRCRIIKRKFV